MNFVGSVKQLQQRHKDTIGLNNEIESLKEVIANHNVALEEQRQFAQNERNNNYELEFKIEQENALVARSRNMLNSYTSQSKDTKVELDAIRRELRATAMSLEQERSTKKFVLQLLNQQRQNLDRTKITVDCFKERLKQVENSNLSAEERMRQLEEMMQNEEKTHDMLLNDIERIQGAIFRSQSALADLKEVFKLKMLKQKVDENALVTLQRQKVQMEIDTRNSAETIYKLHFRINMLENRMARASGERTDDQTEMNQIKLRELKSVLVQVQETTNLLQVRTFLTF